MEDFKDLKVGDKVWTIQLGDCEVIKIDNESIYKIGLTNGERKQFYTIKGFYSEYDKHQSLFRSNPFEKKQDFEPRWMMVSDTRNGNWVKRFVITFKNNKFIAWDNAKTDEEVAEAVWTCTWKYAKEIEQPLEITIEEIAEKFGVSVEQIKIK